MSVGMMAMMSIQIVRVVIVRSIQIVRVVIVRMVGMMSG
jgi:hypothetical protein